MHQFLFVSLVLAELFPMRLSNIRVLILGCAASALIFAALHCPRLTPIPFVSGARKRGVVAGGSPLSVEAGLRILRQGGNATDAGVATILAASVIEFSHFSFGGEVPILIKLQGKNVAW